MISVEVDTRPRVQEILASAVKSDVEWNELQRNMCTVHIRRGNFFDCVSDAEGCSHGNVLLFEILCKEDEISMQLLANISTGFWDTVTTRMRQPHKILSMAWANHVDWKSNRPEVSKPPTEGARRDCILLPARGCTRRNGSSHEPHTATLSIRDAPCKKTWTSEPGRQLWGPKYDS